LPVYKRISDIENKDNQESPVKQQISFSTDLGLIYTAENSSFNRAFENSISAFRCTFSLKVQNFAITSTIRRHYSIPVQLRNIDEFTASPPFEKTLEQVGISYDHYIRMEIWLF
jgi:hypothetical protein